MKKLKILLSVAVFLLLMLLINNLFHFILIDDSESFTRIMMHEMYTQEEDIDVLYLGSSHCYRSLIPEVTDGIFNANTFNAGTSLQQLDATYAMLVETAKTNDLKKVYVELYYGVNGEIFAERTDMTATYLISDYMKPSINKFQLILNASSSEHYVNGFILGRRNWEKLFDLGYIKQTVSKKLSEPYKNYDYISIKGDTYRSKGFMANDLEFTGSSDYITTADISTSFYDNYISDDCRKYIIKIIEFCQKEDIELTFFSAPMTDFSLMTLGNYDSYIKQVKSFLSKYDVKYYDFNLCKTEYLNLENNDYIDPQHLNTAGAEKFSKVFGEFFTGTLTEEIFHDSYNDKVATLGTKILGLHIVPVEAYSMAELYPDLYFDLDNYRYWDIRPLTSGSSAAQYNIEKVTTDGEKTIFQNWDGNSFVYVPINETGMLYIKAQDAFTGQTTGEIQFPY